MSANESNGNDGGQQDTPKKGLSRRTKGLIGLGVSAVLLLLLWGQLFVTNYAGDYMVVQNPFTGSLDWKLTPGLKWRGFGKVTTYTQREQFWFKGDPSAGQDQSIRVRFNDGGYANVSGSISWEMPDDTTRLTALHSKYRSQAAVDQQLIRTVLERSVYLSGPMMSSTESSASRRNELLHVIEDQIDRGAYETETFSDRVKDPITGDLKNVDVVRIKVVGGKPVYAGDSPLAEFGIRTFNLSMNEIKYDPVVETQIKAQQKSAANIQIATAQAKQADQDAITNKQKGAALGAKAKWEKEVLRIAATVSAEKDKDVALLKAEQEKTVAETKATQERDVQMTAAQRDLESSKLKLLAAENLKKAEVLRGEGTAKARELVMNADGALTKKLAAWVEVQEAYAAAIGGYKGQWVPSIQMGAAPAGTPANGGSQQLIDLLTVKTAKDLQEASKGTPKK